MITSSIENKIDGGESWRVKEREAQILGGAPGEVDGERHDAGGVLPEAQSEQKIVFILEEEIEEAGGIGIIYTGTGKGRGAE
jgi:hypothetical protein